MNEREKTRECCDDAFYDSTQLRFLFNEIKAPIMPRRGNILHSSIESPWSACDNVWLDLFNTLSMREQHSPSGSRVAFQSLCHLASGIPMVVHRLDSIALLWFATFLTAAKREKRRKKNRIKFSVSSNWRIYLFSGWRRRLSAWTRQNKSTKIELRWLSKESFLPHLVGRFNTLDDVCLHKNSLVKFDFEASSDTRHTMWVMTRHK